MQLLICFKTMETLQNLITRAKEVRDEAQTGRNTATRVGTLFYNIVLWLGELLGKKQDKTDNMLETNSKEIVGAINEVLEISTGDCRCQTFEVEITEDNGMVTLIRSCCKVISSGYGYGYGGYGNDLIGDFEL